MIKDVLQTLNYEICAEVALLLFVGSFLVVLLQTWLTRPEEARQQADIPLTDGTKKAFR